MDLGLCETTTATGPLWAMLAAINLAARSRGPGRPCRIAAAMAPHLGDPTLLRGHECPADAGCYARHLLAEDAAAGYAVAALVWKPGQMSRIHSHLTWCALGVHAGTLTETLFDACDEGETMPAPSACLLRRPGDTSHGMPGPRGTHRVANLGAGTAISIHVYGAVFADFPTRVNRIVGA